MGMCVLGEWAACRVATRGDSVATVPLLLEMAAEHWHTGWGNLTVSPVGEEHGQQQAPPEGRVHDQHLYPYRQRERQPTHSRLASPMQSPSVYWQG